MLVIVADVIHIVVIHIFAVNLQVVARKDIVDIIVHAKELKLVDQILYLF